MEKLTLQVQNGTEVLNVMLETTIFANVDLAPVIHAMVLCVLAVEVAVGGAIVPWMPALLDNIHLQMKMVGKSSFHRVDHHTAHSLTLVSVLVTTYKTKGPVLQPLTPMVALLPCRSNLVTR